MLGWLSAQETGLIRGIIFDFDGTLIDSYEPIAESLNHVRRSFDRPPLPLDEVKTLVGHGLEHLIEKAVGPAQIQEGVRLFRESYAAICESRTKILPQVRETLEKLERRGYQMAIATNKPSYFARDILRALEIDHLFAEVLGPNDVQRPKPDPEMLEIIMMRLGLGVDEMVYVGDMLIDVEVARSAGVAVYALPTGSAPVIPYIALDKGFFKEEGLEVEGKMYSSGREALDQPVTQDRRTDSPIPPDADRLHPLLAGQRGKGPPDPLGHVLRQFLADDAPDVILAKECHNPFCSDQADK